MSSSVICLLAPTPSNRGVRVQSKKRPTMYCLILSNSHFIYELATNCFEILHDVCTYYCSIRTLDPSLQGGLPGCISTNPPRGGYPIVCPSQGGDHWQKFGKWQPWTARDRQTMGLQICCCSSWAWSGWNYWWFAHDFAVSLFGNDIVWAFAFATSKTGKTWKSADFVVNSYRVVKWFSGVYFFTIIGLSVKPFSLLVFSLLFLPFFQDKHQQKGLRTG